MTTVHLVRHGCHDWLPRGIAGRIEGVSLNEQGRQEAAALSEWFVSRPISAVYSSPLERAQQTAQPIADRLNIPLLITDSLHEFDFGRWNGKEFAALDEDPEWERFNTFRLGVRAPEGELMVEVQARMANFLSDLAAGEYVLVGHGDPIRTALLYLMGMPLEHYDRLEILPGSISTIAIEGWAARITRLNFRPS